MRTPEAAVIAARAGTVYLVGAGPGDPGLLTIRARELLTSADVVVHDGLVNEALLAMLPPTIERIYAGKKRGRTPVAQSAINELLIARARAGQAVVRLKGGDPFMFGRGGEECQLLAAAGVPFEVVPGVTAATAVAAYAGIPLTHRDVASTVAFATAHEADDKTYAAVDAAELARFGTVVLFMGVQSLAVSAARLMEAGRAADTPVAVIRWGTLPAQQVVVGTLADIAELARELKPPGLVVVGGVVNLRKAIAWAERRLLHGARILVTRPTAQAEPLMAALSRLGAEAIACPLIATEPLSDSAAAALDQALARLGDYGWIAVTSANGAAALWARLTATGRDARALASCKLAALGDATAAELARHGLTADLVVGGADAAHGAAQLATELARAMPAPGRLLFPRAEDGRDELPDRLRALGWQVDVVPAYRTVRARPEAIAAPLARLSAGDIDIVTLMSPSAVDALVDALGADARRILQRSNLVAAGSTTAAALARHGLTAAAHGAILDAIMRCWQARLSTQPKEGP